MKRLAHGRSIAVAALALLLGGCAGARRGAESPAAGGAEVDAAASIEAIFLQINDVYEIGPVANGTQGGLARVARVREELLAENPSTFTVLAGDFLSPSALGTAKVDGERLAGRQMVAALNAMGLDLATFGNHEFDIGEETLLARMAESDFGWTSANVFDAEGRPFPGVSPREVLTVEAPGGRTLRIGIASVTTTENRADWVSYTDPLESMKRAVEALAEEADVVIGLTHLSVSGDQALAERLPAIALIMGGHEHDNYFLRRGPRPTPIVKADANAKSVYVHRLSWVPATGAAKIESEYLPITDAIDDEPGTAAVVAEWTQKGYDGFRAQGFDPDEVVAEVPEDLDGLDSSVRFRPTNLTRLIADAMLGDVSDARLAVFNSGSIRLDDKLKAGPITQYDVIRVLPFGGQTFSTRIRGSLLVRALETASRMPGAGGFLQTSANLERAADGWTLDGEAIDPEGTYAMAISDYLASGLENGLEFLDVGAGRPDLEKLGAHSDIRQAVIAELRSRYPAAGGP